MNRVLVVAAVLVSSSAACTGMVDDDTAAPDAGPVVDALPEVDAAPLADPGEVRGTFQLTYYWIAAEAEYEGVADTALYGDACEVLATVPAGFASAIALEGTGRLVDGRLLNVSGSCDCSAAPCYVEAGPDHPWGIGVQDRALEPYRSVAVDRTVVPYGTTLYLAELDGVVVPGDEPWGGWVHDGCVIAADTGGGIVGNHLDWFVGLKGSYRALDGELGLEDVTVHDGGERCPAPSAR